MSQIPYILAAIDVTISAATVPLKSRIAAYIFRIISKEFPHSYHIILKNYRMSAIHVFLPQRHIMAPHYFEKYRI